MIYTPTRRSLASPQPPSRQFTSYLRVEPEEIYHARRADNLSSHALTDFRRNPLLFRKKEQGLIPPVERQAFTVGRAVHCWILEGCAVFNERFAIGGPINPKTGKSFGPETKAYAEWAEMVGKPAISEEHATLCGQLAQAVSEHAEAAKLLALGQPEGVVRTTYLDTPCQIRIDWTHPERGIVDLKTIDNLDWFEMQVRTYGYAHQLAFYRDVLGEVAGRHAPVHVIAVEKNEPHRVGVWHFSEQTLTSASRENRAAMSRLAICRAQDRWPTGYEQIRTFDDLI